MIQKKRTYVSLFFIGLCVLLLAGQIESDTNQYDKKGLLTRTDGLVKKKLNQTEEWIDAENNSPVNSGDQVRTYQRSRAELELMKLDVIRMAPETTIDVVKLYEETKDKVKETQLNLQQGDIWAKLTKKDATMKFDITTPVAGAAITGTIFRLGVESDSTTELKVYTGEVRISNAPEKTNLSPQYIGKPQEIPGPHEIEGPHEVTMEEWVYIIKNMQRITIGNDGSVKSVGKFSLKDRDEQSEWVKWNLKLDRLMK